jgi:hypothetical protein
MFTLAIKWRMRLDNPCKGIERNPETPRTRYLSGAELEALTEALGKHRDQQAANVIRLLLLTGAFSRLSRGPRQNQRRGESAQCESVVKDFLCSRL